MRIAVDAMGGDHAPAALVEGSIRAARELPHLEKLFLVGDESAIRNELKKHGPIPDKIEIRHCTEVVAMNEPPATAVRRKKDSSINRATDLVKSGEAAANVFRLPKGETAFARGNDNAGRHGWHKNGFG